MLVQEGCCQSLRPGCGDISCLVDVVLGTRNSMLPYFYGFDPQLNVKLQFVISHLYLS